MNFKVWDYLGEVFQEVDGEYVVIPEWPESENGTFFLYRHMGAYQVVHTKSGLPVGWGLGREQAVNDAVRWLTWKYTVEESQRIIEDQIRSHGVANDT